ncbi:flagellin lysine-N-methylase [Erwinia sorbitola]|uniref:Lysine-N-methylase fliB n=1 Tax=Erwinia sorbitola TaxID=2681984 RepID=A0A6I6F1U6_9GAMM|nr:flagellin lysine-N-methylase [Erwinia sorbitola]MTD25571.1 lysine-N-methylase fliB [Erwinia sorbitola]QGU87870.1 lysine-N-methylase fliB [Erwinia sorbitola]
MKEITVVEPVFVTDFRCVGSECRDHCCKGWDVTLDKTTVNRYLKSAQIEIRNIASENIVKVKKSFKNWGLMKLTSKGNCAFMDEEKLCKVHKQMGPSALSPTCATYPRTQYMHKYEVKKSLTLSCPEATQKLLTRPDAMLFNQTVQIQAEANKNEDVDNEHKLVNLMCANMVKAAGCNANEGLYGIAMLLLHLEQMKKEQGFNSEALENDYFNIMDAIGNGSAAQNIAEINNNQELQWSLLMRMQTYFSSKTKTRSSDMLQHYLTKLVHIQISDAKDHDIGSSMTRLDAVWNEKVMPWMAERPHLISNYLQYRIYSDSFPGYQGRSPLASLYLLTAEWFMIRSLIAACVELVGEIYEDDIINIIYSFHAVTKHNNSSMAAFFEEIDNVKVNDDLSLIYLLK